MSDKESKAPDSYELLLNSLLDYLIKGTSEGWLQWESTSDKDLFQIAFSNYSVQVVDSMVNIVVGSRSRVLRLYDSTGGHLYDMPDEDNRVSHLFAIVKRQVLGVNTALKDILGEIKEMEPPKN